MPCRTLNPLPRFLELDIRRSSENPHRVRSTSAAVPSEDPSSTTRTSNCNERPFEYSRILFRLSARRSSSLKAGITMESSNGKQTFTLGSMRYSEPFPPGYCSAFYFSIFYLEVHAFPI